jgi:hypothetical protein
MIRFPDGTAFRRGDSCDGQTPGQLRLLVNGIEILRRFRHYVPGNWDHLEIRFE